MSTISARPLLEELLIKGHDTDVDSKARRNVLF